MNQDLKDKFEALLEDKEVADYLYEDKRPEYFIKSLEGSYFGNICCEMGCAKGKAEAYIKSIFMLLALNINIPDELFELANSAIEDYNKIYIF